MSEENASPKAMFSDLVQIGIVVRDIDRTVKYLTEVFGMGPFRIITYPPEGRTDIERFYYGKPTYYHSRQAFAEVGPVEIELIQPLDGDTIWEDYLREHGEGIHHIRFNVLDLEPVFKHLEENGIGPSMMGSGLRPGTYWVNFDTQEKIGFTIEVMKKLAGSSGRTPQFTDGKVVS